MSRIIELTWTCSQCGRKIKGRHKTCPYGCGSSREASEMSMEGLDTDRDGDGFNDAATVTDPELLDLANAGADWFCQHCESGNRGDTDTCSVCSAPRYGEKEENHPAPQFANDHIGKRKLEEWEHTEDTNPGGYYDKAEASRKRAQEQEEAREEARRRAEEKRKRDAEWAVEQEARRVKLAKQEARQRALLIFGGLSLMMAAIALIIWAMQTHAVVGEATKLSWSQTETVQTWTQVAKSGWRDDIHERPESPPSFGKGGVAGIDITSCRQKEHHKRKYPCGTEMETYDCSTSHTESYQDTCYKSESYTCGETCRDNGNGFATCSPKTCSKQVSYSCTKTRTVRDPKTCQREVPKYCYEPIYKDWCSYQTQEWQNTPSRSMTVTGYAEVTATGKVVGTGADTYWPNVELRRLEQKSRSGKYEVVISYSDRGKSKTHEHNPNTEKGFNSWSLLDKATLDINNLGRVSSMQRGVVDQ